MERLGSLRGHGKPAGPFKKFFVFQLRKKTSLTEAEKEEAERLKTEGNDLMRSEQYEAAIEKYTKSVSYEVFVLWFRPKLANLGPKRTLLGGTLTPG